MAKAKRRKKKESEALSARPSDVFNSVPSFKEYFPTVGSMSKKVRAFGAEIHKEEFQENEGQCDNYFAEDTVYAGHFPELGFE